MAGLGDLIEEYVNDPLRKALGTYMPKPGPTELPEEYPQPFNDLFGSETPFDGMRRSTVPTDLPSRIRSYRADERRGGLENLPQSRFDNSSPLKSDVRYWAATSDNKKIPYAANEIQKMYAFARLNGAASKLGLPTINPDQFAAMILKEGRSDAGFNTFKPEAKPDVEFRKRLDQFNIPERQKDYLGMVNYADRIAKKKDVPFHAVWNGLGKNWKGQTGFDYAKAMKAHEQAATNPKNKDFLNLISRAFSEGEKYGLPLMKEKQRDTDPYLKADPDYKYHTPDGKKKPHGLDALFKASGGVVIDDNNPAKQRKLI
jgi:hypothetical protein